MSGASRESKGMYGFDPSGLERAAKAAGILDKSKNAKEAFTLALKEEEIKLLKEQNLLREREILKEKLEAENKKNIIQMEIEANKQKALYEDHLAKERIELRLKKEKDNNDFILKKQEESVKKQELEKQKTLTHEHNLKVLQDKLKIENKYYTKAKIEKDNFDILQKKIQLNRKEERETKLKIRELTLNKIGNGIKMFISDKTMFNRFIFGITSTLILSYAMKKTINLSFQYIKNKLFTPKLVKETSKFSLNLTLQRVKHLLFLRKNNNLIFQGLFFNSHLKNQLEVLSQTLINKKNFFQKNNKNIPFRNFLFYGPPGTGKTAFAKNLATKTGIDYAILTGADIAPLGVKAVVELNKVFDWANLSRKGVLLFIDESDAFLRKRNISNNSLSENLRNAINCFLYRTGNQTNKFFFVLATNEPTLLDKAVQDRIDEIIKFDIPDIKQREEIFIYNAKIIFDKENFEIFTKNLKIICEKTQGFSGRECVKFIVTLYHSCFQRRYTSDSLKYLLTSDIIKYTLDQFIKEKYLKLKWINETNNIFSSRQNNH